MNTAYLQQNTTGIENQSKYYSQLTKQLDRKQSHKLPRKKLSFGERLYKAGQDAELVYLVNQGFIKTVVHSVMGRDRIVDIYGPGEIIGSAALEDCVHGETAQAISSSSLTPIDPEYALRNAAFSKYLNTILAKQVCRHREAINDAAMPVGARLCKLLIRLSERFGETVGPDIRLPFMITQEEFASMIGSSRITISRIFSYLRSTGAVIGKRGNFVLNIEGLEQAIDVYVLEVI